MAERKQTLLVELKQLLGQLSGQDFSQTPEDSSFLELGFDSLFLTQIAIEASKAFRVKLKLRDFLDAHPTLGEMTAHLDATLPAGEHQPVPSAAEVTAAPASPSAPVVSSPVSTPSVSRPPAVPGALSQLMALSSPLGKQGGPVSGESTASAAVAELVRQQIQIMAAQIQLLGSAGLGVPAIAGVDVPAVAAANPGQGSPPASPKDALRPPQSAETSSGGAPPADVEPADGKPHRQGPQLVIERGRGEELSPAQEQMIARVQERYCARTGKSKAFTQRNRSVVADPRVPAGFKVRLKELVYPIVVERSEGCRLWDLDGNEYIDMLSGYGSNYFGFGAPFVKQAIREQMDRGMEIGPQTPLIEEVSELFRKLVPADRVAFCNTGSEAVLATLRMARTVTGRDRIVMFRGGYHGIFDEVIVRGTPRLTSLPAAPGIPRSAVENMTVLDWASEQSLTWLREHAEELAAVLVEPVQSRAPDIQPREFLHELRKITEASGTTLIFDEVVTGFRVGPGGAQEHFGVQADLASYGKVVGGGVSIGIIAGKREYMDALDGGFWQFGDASIPEVGVTYFAGTFVRHPIAMAAARAVLKHLIAEGPGLQQRVNRLTDEFATRLNTFFRSENVPVEVRHFSSVMRIVTTEPVPAAELLFCLLRERGIHTWDGRPNYFTTVHTEREIDAIIAAFKAAVAQMQEARFYPRPTQHIDASKPPAPGARLGRDQQGNPAWFLADPSSPGKYMKLETA